MSESANAWQRLSPIAIVFYLLRITRQFINNALQGLAPLIILIISSKDKMLIITLTAIALLSFILITAILQYWYFRYQVTDNEVQINQGVFKKKFRAIAFDRVQNINIKQPIYFKPFALVSLFIETAGSSGDEGVLAGINETDAQALTDLILKQRDIAQAQQDQEAPASHNSSAKSSATLLTQVSTQDLIKHGLSNNKFLLFMAFLAPFYNQLEKQVNHWVQSINIDPWLALFPTKPIAFIVTFILAAMLLFMSFALISIVTSILNYHNYQLSLNKQTLVRKSGLLNTHQESLNLTKIQTIQRRCNWIAKALGVESLILTQADGNTGAQQRQHNKSAHLFLVPARTPSQSMTLIETITGKPVQMQPTCVISKRFISKNWLLYFVLPVLAFTAVQLGHGDMPSMFLLLIPLLGLPLVYRRWQGYGFRLEGEYGLVKSGFIGYRYELFALYKAQKVVLKQSWWQKRAGVANLRIVLASSTIVIPYMSQTQALAWFNQLCYHIERDNQPWF